MDEQRYVVEITRPVPPEKVGQVAQRIAERLNVPVERIVTLLDGRVGEVTKPVLAEKADAIVEVFAEAGVRVIVVAARVDPPPYQEQFGVPPEDEAPVDEPPVDEYPVDEFPEDEFPVDEFPEDQDDDPDDDVPWGQEVTWGFDSAAAQEWTRPSGEEDAEYEPYEVQDELSDEPSDESSDESSDEPPEMQEDSYDGPYDDPSYAAPDAWPPVNPEPRPTAHVPEEEADRLGPTPRPLRVAYEYPADTLGESQPPESEEGNAAPGISTGHRTGDDPVPPRYAASTRWTPSPHDPFAFAPEDAPGYEGRRATPMGPARTTPLSAGAEGAPNEARDSSRDAIGGFFSPEEEPREGPQLRVYLLWALAISLLVLILLQFVMALRVDGTSAAVAGAFEAGLVAYRKGDFGAARNIWEPVADAGNAQAQYFLGFMLQNGLGQPWSNARAANWYRRAAHQGLPEAQLALGDLYLRGMGVELDPRVGAAWYASAAVAGDPTGQYEYAKLLLHGVGVEQDMSTALAWFEAAAAGGHEAAADYVRYARANAGALSSDGTRSPAQDPH